MTLASSTAASSGSLPGVAARYPSGSLDLAEASMASAEGSAFSTPSSGRCASGSLDLAEASMASTAGSAVSTRCSSGSLDLAEASMASTAGSAFPTVLVARDTLGLTSLGMLVMFFEVLRLVLCRLGAGSGVLLRGISGSLIISLLWPWELDIVLEMLVQ